MKWASKFILLVGIFVLMAGCKLAVIVVEGGEVQSTGSGICVASAICIVDVNDAKFSETFTAVPYTDWYFQKWNSGDRLFCGGSTDPTCTLSFQEHEESKAVEDMIASSETFYLMPVFKPYKDVITVDGKQWLQAELFKNLTWDEINAVCPAGECTDNGSLNGYDMTGWTWASVDDVKTLFNVYIGDSSLDSDTRFYPDNTGQALQRFYGDGWQPTFDGYSRALMVTEWRVMLRDQQSSNFGRRTEGVAFALLSHDFEGEFNAASFSVRFTSTEGAEAGYAAAFYR